MKDKQECSYGNIMRFCKHITRRELERGHKYDYIQNMLVKAVEMGCAQGLSKFLDEIDVKEYMRITYATKRKNNRNEEHTYKKD